MNLEETLDQYYTLWRLLDYTCRLVNTARAKPLRRIGLSHESAAILSAVSRLNNRATPIELARYATRKPQTMTSILNKMEKQGLILKTLDEDKKNSYKISLTEKGQQLFQKAAKVYVYQRILSTLSEEQRRELREMLEIVKEKAKRLA
jgi:DNA-binding MarR family transcriptional regulator